MSDYGRAITFGINIDPSAADLTAAYEAARRADAAGLDLIGIQDHPSQRRFLDTWMLMATLLAETERIHVFPNVANLPLRGATMIAKQAVSLDILSGGRFELALGAGTFWEAIGAMGGPVRRPGEALGALEEAVRGIRFLWSDAHTVSFDGRFYALHEAHPGPPPVHPIGIWVGALKPRMLRLTGRLADGWSVSLPYAPPEQLPAMQRLIDEGAATAGHQPQAIRRLYNLMGTITEGPARGLLQGPVQHWVETLTRFTVELGLDTFIFWPEGEQIGQLERFAAAVVPGVREAVARERACPTADAEDRG
jgi:alkanesulfonate monooxygenase SsuD/methylene tetrahydromethanopterin reductase-like flavin-dependent oxidoreductase (luciferase family)